MTLAVVLALGGAFRPWWLPVLAALLLLPFSEVAVGLVNQVLTLFLPPRVLPKLDVKDGIPAEHATFVVIPSMLARPASAAALLERLETPLPGQPRPEPPICPTHRFHRRPQETMPQDEGLIDDAIDRVRGVEQALRATAAADIFFLFHRRRLWNAVAGLLDGLGTEAREAAGIQSAVARRPRYELYRAERGPGELAAGFRFVITLDADTQMPRDTAGRLVGTLAHPLNRPRFDAVGAAGRVGLWRAAAADQLPPDGGNALAIRRAAGDLRRHRSLFDGCLRRLHGSVR